MNFYRLGKALSRWTIISIASSYCLFKHYYMVVHFHTRQIRTKYLKQLKHIFLPPSMISCSSSSSVKRLVIMRTKSTITSRINFNTKAMVLSPHNKIEQRGRLENIITIEISKHFAPIIYVGTFSSQHVALICCWILPICAK